MEFLDAIGESPLNRHIAEFSNLKNITPGIHEKLIGLIRKYMIIGGMPAPVSKYVETNDYNAPETGR
jgi:hypothetical protein